MPGNFKQAYYLCDHRAARISQVMISNYLGLHILRMHLTMAQVIPMHWPWRCLHVYIWLCVKHAVEDWTWGMRDEGNIVEEKAGGWLVYCEL